MQDEVLELVTGAFEALEVPHLVCGSIISSYYGEPRFTRDINIVCDLRAEQVGPLHDHFDDEEWYFFEPAIREAIGRRTQFNLIHLGTMLKVDCILSPRTIYGRTQLNRRQRLPLLPGGDAWAAQPEDVILSKLLYFREGGSHKHPEDIAAMILVSGDELDYDYLADWAGRLGVDDLWRQIQDDCRR